MIFKCLKRIRLANEFGVLLLELFFHSLHNLECFAPLYLFNQQFKFYRIHINKQWKLFSRLHFYIFHKLSYGVLICFLQKFIWNAFISIFSASCKSRHNAIYYLLNHIYKIYIFRRIVMKMMPLIDYMYLIIPAISPITSKLRIMKLLEEFRKIV